MPYTILQRYFLTQVGIRRKTFLAERGNWCKKWYLSPGVAKKIPEAVPFTSKQNHDHR